MASSYSCILLYLEEGRENYTVVGIYIDLSATILSRRTTIDIDIDREIDRSAYY